MTGVEVATAWVTVLPSTQGFHKALAGDVNAAATKAGQSGGQAAGTAFTAGFGKAAAGVGAAMAGLFTARALVSGIGSAIDAGSNLAESQSKVAVVFGTSAKAINQWASTASDSMVMSSQAALEAAGTYGNLFQAFGIGQQKAASMSTTLVQLAADLASFNNTSVEDALTALRSGLSGETEPLKRYGVAITDVRLKQEAMAQGLWDGTGALEAAGKAQATYALILQDTKLAQGDVTRTADGYANTIRALSASVEDAKATIGTEFLNTIQDAGGGSGLSTSIDIFGERVANVIAGVGSLIAKLNELSPGGEKPGYADGFTNVRSGPGAWDWLSTGMNPLAQAELAWEAYGASIRYANDEIDAHYTALAAYDTHVEDSATVTRLAGERAQAYADYLTTMTDRTVAAATGVDTLRAALDRFAGKQDLGASSLAIREKWAALSTMGDRVMVGKGKDRHSVAQPLDPDVKGNRFANTESGREGEGWLRGLVQQYEDRATMLSEQGRNKAAHRMYARAQSRIAGQLDEWGFDRPGVAARGYLAEPQWLRSTIAMERTAAGTPGVTDESRKLGMTVNINMTVDSSAAIEQGIKEAKRLAASSGGRFVTPPHGAPRTGR